MILHFLIYSGILIPSWYWKMLVANNVTTRGQTWPGYCAENWLLFIYSFIFILDTLFEITNIVLSCLFSSRVSVSRAIKPFSESGRPPDWFSQKVGNIKLLIMLSLKKKKIKQNIILFCKKKLFWFCFFVALCLSILWVAGGHRSTKVSIQKRLHTK